MRVAIIGTGLIGGSIGYALRALGHDVAGFDLDAERLANAKERGAIDRAGTSIADAAEGASVAFVALPVGAIPDAVAALLDTDTAVVTDVGSVKQPIVDEVTARCGPRAARFVGGHPMAGSEQDGIDGARADLFLGAAWVLTPTTATAEAAYTELRELLRAFEAHVVTVRPDEHDALVSFVSHVPQLAASTLMNVANAREEEHRALLRLAAGGFRDMTRIAASHPTIWVDILTANRDAVLAALDAYLEGLTHARSLVERSDRDALKQLLETARTARRNLPVAASVTGDLVEVSVAVRDQVGVFAEITTLAARLDVNIAAIYSADSSEGGGGVLVLSVPAASAERYEAALRERGYHVSRSEPE
jgi:prephenate dehydrogenase